MTETPATYDPFIREMADTAEIVQRHVQYIADMREQLEGLERKLGVLVTGQDELSDILNELHHGRPVVLDELQDNPALGRIADALELIAGRFLVPPYDHSEMRS